jgi:hypothetical protein
MDEVDCDLGAFDNDVIPEDGKSSRVTSRPQRRTAPATPNTSVMGITNDRMVNIHFGWSTSKFTAEQMQQFIDELDEAYRSNRYVVKDTIF